MKILRPHKSKREIIRDKIESLVPSLINRFGENVSDLKHVWQGDDMEFSFRARGFTVNGTITVSDSDVHMDLRLPLAAKMFEGRIKSAIEKELDKLLPEKL